MTEHCPSGLGVTGVMQTLLSLVPAADTPPPGMLFLEMVGEELGAGSYPFYRSGPEK